MESKAIAIILEQDHPSPPLYLDSPILKEVENLLPKILVPLKGVWMPAVPGILSEPSAEYFHRTRGESLGKSLEEYAQHSGGEEAWIEALPPIHELGELIKKESGPYVMGETREWLSESLERSSLTACAASYADFVIVGALHFFRRIGEVNFERIVKIEPAYGKLYDACKQWLERDGH